MPFLGTDYSTGESDASLQLDTDSDHVSVLYVKDGTKKELENDSRVSVLYVEETKKTVGVVTPVQPGIDNSMSSECEARDDGDITSEAVRRIRFSKVLNEID